MTSLRQKGVNSALSLEKADQQKGMWVGEMEGSPGNIVVSSPMERDRHLLPKARTIVTFIKSLLFR